MAIMYPVRKRMTGIWRQRRSRSKQRLRPTRLAVLPCRAEAETMAAVQGAIREGVDGIFLAADGIGYQNLLGIARMVVSRHPSLFIGVRCSDLRPQDVFCRLPPGVRGVWTSGFSAKTDGGKHLEESAAIEQARRESGWEGLYFITAYIEALNPAVAKSGCDADAREAVRLAIHDATGADVIVLAGPEGAVFSSRELVRLARMASGNRPIAIIEMGGAWESPRCVLRIQWPPPTHFTRADR